MPSPRALALALLLSAAVASAARADVSVTRVTPAPSPQASAAYRLAEPDDGTLLHLLPKTTKPARGWPTIVIVPGHHCAPDDYTQLRDTLLRRGYGVALFAWDDNSDLQAARWDERLATLVQGLHDETRRLTSPLRATVDTAKLGILGHSLGGAVATLRAARDPRFKALAVFGPGGQDAGFLDEARAVRGATIAIDGSLDRVTPPDEHGGVVAARANTAAKAHVIIRDGNHPNAPADFDADYIRESGRWVAKPIAVWPFVTWVYDFPINRDIKPIPGATQRAIAFRYLVPWFDRFVAGRDSAAIRQATDGRRAARDVADGVLSEASFSPGTSTSATPTAGLVGALPGP